MLPFYFKRVGYFVIILSFTLMIIIKTSFFSLLTDAEYEVCKWIGLFGLVLITISIEKNETAETERLRFRCFFRVFFGMLLVVVVFSLSNLLFTNDKVSIGKALWYLKDNDVLKFSILFLAVHLSSFRRELKKLDRTS